MCTDAVYCPCTVDCAYIMYMLWRITYILAYWALWSLRAWLPCETLRNNTQKHIHTRHKMTKCSRYLLELMDGHDSSVQMDSPCLLGDLVVLKVLVSLEAPVRKKHVFNRVQSSKKTRLFIWSANQIVRAVYSSSYTPLTRWQEWKQYGSSVHLEKK